jgi:hypothetical protein
VSRAPGRARWLGPDVPRAATRWAVEWAGARADETLDIPSTATLSGGWLWAVNARFGVSSPGTASYWITRLPAV